MMPNMIQDLKNLVMTSKSEPGCDWCGEPDNLHICRECQKHILDVTCHKYQGLCADCFAQWGA